MEASHTRKRRARPGIDGSPPPPPPPPRPSPNSAPFFVFLAHTCRLQYAERIQNLGQLGKFRRTASEIRLYRFRDSLLVLINP